MIGVQPLTGGDVHFQIEVLPQPSVVAGDALDEQCGHGMVGYGTTAHGIRATCDVKTMGTSKITKFA